MLSSSVEDSFGNNILDTYGHRSIFNIEDVTRPELVTFSINMQTGTLNLTFNDVVRADTFDPTALMIQKDQLSLPEHQATLSSSTSALFVNDVIIQISISVQDLIRIKEVPDLAVNKSTTYIVMQAYAIDDLFGVDVLAITNGKATQVGEFFADVTPPDLFEFSFDLNLGTLIMTFTDTVNADSLIISSITLSNSDSIIATRITLTNGTVSRSSLGSEVTLTIDNDDLNSMKEDTTLAISNTTLFLSVQPDFIVDLAGNFAPEIALATPMPVSQFIDDSTGAIVTSFDLDMNTGTITLYFSETVNASTIDPSAITLQPQSDSTSRLSESFTLNGQTSASILNKPVVTTTMLFDDVNSIKAITTLASDGTNSFLAYTSMLIQDMSGNQAISRGISCVSRLS